MAIKNAIIVGRVSTPTQNVESQIHEMTDYCHNNNLSIIDTKTIHNSAYKALPFDLYDVVNEIAKYELPVDYLVFADVDRFARNVTKGIELIETIKQMNIRIVFVREPMIDCFTPDGMHLLRQKLSQAELESDKIGQRVKVSNLMRKNRGEKLGTSIFGKMKIDQTIVDNPKEQAIIKIIRIMASFAHTVAEIMQEFKSFHTNFDPLRACEKYCMFTSNENEEVDEGNILQFSFHDIAEMLNSFFVKKRNREWNDSMVRYVCKQNNIDVTHVIAKRKRQDTDDESVCSDNNMSACLDAVPADNFEMVE